MGDDSGQPYFASPKKLAAATYSPSATGKNPSASEYQEMKPHAVLGVVEPRQMHCENGERFTGDFGVDVTKMGSQVMTEAELEAL